MAGDQPVDGPVIQEVGGRPGGRATKVLTRLVVVLAAVAVVGGVFVVRDQQVRSRDAQTQERYGTVQQAASDEVTALFNIDYRSPQQTLDKVKAGATPDFASQVESGAGSLVTLTAQAKSVMTATVIWTGVVDIDPDSATVIVATTGTVTNTQTGDQPAARNFRVKVDLVHQDGRWLTSGLDFVPVSL